VSANSVNVAHELAHRKLPFKKTRKAFVNPCVVHAFFFEHDFGHHLHAATPEDPATAKHNQSISSF
jgi:alkane 1-monooxygenase